MDNDDFQLNVYVVLDLIFVDNLNDHNLDDDYNVHFVDNEDDFVVKVIEHDFQNLILMQQLYDLMLIMVVVQV